MNKPKTLIVCPHADDETFGLSGYIQRFQHTEDIRIVVLSSGHDEENSIIRRKVCTELLRKFDITFSISIHKACSFDQERSAIAGKIERTINEFQPQKILIPSDTDLHQDHKLVNSLCKIASKPTRHKFINEILEYSVPESEMFSSSYYDTVLNLTDSEMIIKRACAYKYSTEHIPELPNFEKFRTIFRRL